MFRRLFKSGWWWPLRGSKPYLGAIAAAGLGAFPADPPDGALYLRQPDRIPFLFNGANWHTLRNADAGCPGRLSTDSADAFPTTDQTGKTQVHLVPVGRGGAVELYDAASEDWVPRALDEAVSLTLPSTTYRILDVFLAWVGGRLVLEFENWNQTSAALTNVTAASPCVVTSASHGQSDGTLIGINNVTGTVGTNTNNGVNGRVWTAAGAAANTFQLQGSDGTLLAYAGGGNFYSVPNTRITSLTKKNGRWTKASDPTRLYVGSVMNHATAGQTEDSVSRRLVWNNYNRRLVPLRVTETEDYNYSAAAYRPLRNIIANRVEFIQGLSEDMVSASAMISAYHDTAGFTATSSGIGLKRTNASDAQQMGAYVEVANATVLTSAYEGHPGLGYSYLQWIEIATASGITSWLGDSTVPSMFQSSLLARVWC